MSRELQTLYSLNRGEVSRLGLARRDVKRLALAAQKQTNWMPRVLGAMMLRPGFQYLGSTYGNAAARFLRFIFSTTDTALLELTDSLMRVWVDDALLTRPAVTTTVTNGTFATNLSSWTDNDDAGGTSTWASPNYMQLVGSGTDRAIREQAVTVATADMGVEHALRITIARGPVTLRVGSSSGDDDYVRETTLQTGAHSIAFTPAGSFYIRFFSRKTQKVWVSGCVVEAAGVVTLPTPWTASDLSLVRYDQSADVLFVACAGHQQRRIERRGTRPNARSWSVALYANSDGPFNLQNTTPTTISSTAINGNVTLVASVPLFKSTHVGALFSVTSVGQQVTATASAAGQFTSSIRVTGVGSQRIFTVTISGNATASTVDLQRSYDNVTWANNGGTSVYTADGTTAEDDSASNQIIYYRLILTTRLGADNVTMTLTYGSGSVRGIARITDYASSVSVSAEVVSDLGGTTASSTWQEGKWSDLKGWPTSCRIHEGRLWWAGVNGVVGSISDAYESFDETYLGDAGPINRTIGSGPVDTINWVASLKGMLLGGQGAEHSARASSLDEPLTPANFNLKVSSTQGSGAVDAVKIDQSAYFVDRTGAKVFELAFNLQSYDYSSANLMQLAPDIGSPGIIRMDCQRKPDTRLHCVKSDGTAIVAVVDRSEDVLAWIPIETDGLIEDVVVLPAEAGDQDDRVYYVVKRTINGSTVRYLERWAQESECRGDQAACRLADAFVVYNGASATIITGLGHLEGKSVVVWADGVDVGTDDSATTWTQRYTVSGGQITLAAPASVVVVGLGYTAKFQSAKLGLQTQIGGPLNQQKKLGHIGLILADTHRKGVRFGPSFDVLDDMPEIEAGTDVTAEVTADYDENMIEFPGTWTTDARVCVQAQAPRPATVLAITPDVSQFS